MLDIGIGGPSERTMKTALSLRIESILSRDSSRVTAPEGVIFRRIPRTVKRLLPSAAAAAELTVKVVFRVGSSTRKQAAGAPVVGQRFVFTVVVQLLFG